MVNFILHIIHRMRNKAVLRIFAFLLILLPLLDFCTHALQKDADPYDVNDIVNETEEFCANQSIASTVYDTLFENFRNNESIYLYDETFHYTVTGCYEDQFPNSFGGAYLNKQGNLVLMIVSSSTEEEKNILLSSIDREYLESIIIYDTAKYSYSELISGMTDMYNYCESEEYKSLDYQINGYGIIDSINKIEVGITPYNQVVINDICAHLKKSDLYVFTEGCMEEEAVSRNCGNAIGKTTTNLSFSIGYRARTTNSTGYIDGFVTCAHALPTSCTVYVNSGSFGTFDVSNSKYSGTVDAAFVKLNTGSTVTTTIGTTSLTLQTSQIVNVTVGNTIYMYGKKSGLESGVVLSSTYTSNSTGNPTLTDQVKADYICQHGDSGGVTYKKVNNLNYVTGINVRTAASYSIACKAYNINNALGASIR